jgi:Rrf2 family protein
MLTFSRKMDYTLVALAELARNADATTSVRDLADRLRVPTRLLANILSELKRRGVVASTRGTNGGYSLARPADAINLAELIEAIEGPVRLALCCSDSAAKKVSNDKCGLQHTCEIKGPVQRLHRQLRLFLSHVTLQDIVCNTVSVNMGVVDDGERSVTEPCQKAPMASSIAG